jgi:hypothetical protein
MNIERMRALWKKTLPYVLAAFSLGAVGSVAARHFAGDSCCKPGASCCYPGSACCHRGGHEGQSHTPDRVSQR